MTVNKQGEIGHRQRKARVDDAVVYVPDGEAPADVEEPAEIETMAYVAAAGAVAVGISSKYLDKKLGMNYLEKPPIKIEDGNVANSSAHVFSVRLDEESVILMGSPGLFEGHTDTWFEQMRDKAEGFKSMAKSLAGYGGAVNDVRGRFLGMIFDKGKEREGSTKVGTVYGKPVFVGRKSVTAILWWLPAEPGEKNQGASGRRRPGDAGLLSRPCLGLGVSARRPLYCGTDGHHQNHYRRRDIRLSRQSYPCKYDPRGRKT